MSQITMVLILGVTVEAIVEYAKLLFRDKAFNWKQLAAVGLGIGLAILAQVDLFAAVGVTFIVPYVGMVLTGIVFSRGANYAADFIKLIQTTAAGQAETVTDTREFDHVMRGEGEDEQAE